MEVVKEAPPPHHTLRRRPDEPKFQIGDKVLIKEGVIGVVLARNTPSGGRNEVRYIFPSPAMRWVRPMSWRSFPMKARTTATASKNPPPSGSGLRRIGNAALSQAAGGSMIRFDMTNQICRRR
jgi:hypothetical protein